MVIKKIKKHGKRVVYATRKHATKLQKAARKQTIAAISAAFAFVIALVWRDAIRNTLDSVVVRLGIPETAYAYEIIVAVMLTVFCVMGIVIVSRFVIKE